MGGCVATLYDGRVCDEPAIHELVRFELCRKHWGKAVADIARWRRQEAELEPLRALLQRLEAVTPKFTKRKTGWAFDVGLPTREGVVRRLHRSGFPTRLDAERAWRLVIVTRLQELKSTIECYNVDADRRARAAREQQRLVYYVRRPDGAIKIGTTWNLRSRMQAFRNVAPTELLAHHLGGRTAEVALHRRFRHLRLDGEWFSPAPELLDHVQHVATRVEHRNQAAS